METVDLKIIRRPYFGDFGRGLYDVELAGARTHQNVNLAQAVFHKIELTHALSNMGYRKIHEEGHALGASLQRWERK